MSTRTTVLVLLVALAARALAQCGIACDNFISYTNTCAFNNQLTDSNGQYTLTSSTFTAPLLSCVCATNLQAMQICYQCQGLSSEPTANNLLNFYYEYCLVAQQSGTDSGYQAGQQCLAEGDQCFSDAAQALAGGSSSGSGSSGSGSSGSSGGSGGNGSGSNGSGGNGGSGGSPPAAGSTPVSTPAASTPASTPAQAISTTPASQASPTPVSKSSARALRLGGGAVAVSVGLVVWSVLLA